MPAVLTGRPAESRGRIIRELRARIVGGELSPGSRLPTRTEIEAFYGAGPTTVQRALDHLRRDGFIESRGRNGTFVTHSPPHLNRYAMVFVNEPQAMVGNRFWAALQQQAQILDRENHDWELQDYWGVDGHPDSREYVLLRDEVIAHRVAGLIFTSLSHKLEGTPLMDEPGIPRVAIMQPLPHVKMPVVFLDTDSFFERAAEVLAAAGRKKVAFINPVGRFYGGCEERTNQTLEAHGLETRPHWWVCVPIEAAELARRFVALLLHGARSEWPDALVVSDDNLVEHVIAGLVELGVRVPRDLEVVTHCNFPYPVPSVVPVRRVGFDVSAIVRACTSCIDRQRRGEEEVPAVTKIPAVVES